MTLNPSMEIPTLSIGDALLRHLEIAYCARLPMLLEGHRGVGKSQIFEQLAERLGIEFICLDLSLLERSDLIGLPREVDGKLVFLRPAFWPTEGEGIIVFEELNRCPEHVRAAALEILTRHRVGVHALPPGWVFAACINPVDDDYSVEELCLALRSRFVQFSVKPAITDWIQWAREEDRVHPKVAAFLEEAPGVFDDPNANPRAWDQASKLLRESEKQQIGRKEIEQLVAGVVGVTWSLAFLEFYTGKSAPLSVMRIVADYDRARPTVRRWVQARRLDLVNATLEKVRRHLESPRSYRTVLRNPRKLTNVRAFMADLPPDLRRDLTKWLLDNDRREILLSDLDKAA